MVLQLAKENPLLGYLDIANRINNLGWDISYQTVRTILLDHGLEPSTQRSRRISWAQFLKRNWPSLYALDFTTVETNHRGALQTHYVLFVIKLSTREAHYVGHTRNPNKHWVQQQCRQLSDPDHGFLKDCSHLIMDNDSILHNNAIKPLRDIGITTVRTPIKAPNCNTYIERFIQSFKRDALSFIIPQSGRQLDTITKEYITFYNQERNHQGCNGHIINPQESIGSSSGVIHIRSRNGGSLNYYYRCAA